MPCAPDHPPFYGKKTDYHPVGTERYRESGATLHTPLSDTVQQQLSLYYSMFYTHAIDDADGFRKRGAEDDL